jgi:hypothetical protein
MKPFGWFLFQGIRRGAFRVLMNFVAVGEPPAGKIAAQDSINKINKPDRIHSSQPVGARCGMRIAMDLHGTSKWIFRKKDHMQCN